MPCKNVIKRYLENGYYHIYNRGVEKRTIFEEHEDYVVFLRLLKEYLLPLGHPDLLVLQGINPRRHAVNCSQDINLLAYCLMPNHFHLFVKQLSSFGLQRFMKALLTNYSMYFNHKYDRVGPLFQGTYKGALISSEQYYFHLSRYIHLNPQEIIARDKPLYEYPYSSYQYYIKGKGPDWVDVKEVLSFFRSSPTLGAKEKLSYQNFVESSNYGDSTDVLGNLILE